MDHDDMIRESTDNAVNDFCVATRSGVLTKQTQLRIRSGFDGASPLNNTHFQITLFDSMIMRISNEAYRVEFDAELRIVQLRIVLDTTWEQRPIYEDSKRGQFSTKEESITK